MEMQKSFRSAFNGFNREDVVQYINYLNTKHATELAQLNSELEYLRSKPEPQAVAEAQEDTMEQQAARLQELQSANQALEAELARAKEQIAQLEAEAQQVATANVEAELEAYRRAERMERLAREKANQLYHQANGVLADAGVRVEETASQIGALAEQVMEQLAQLRTAVGGSKETLSQAAATLAAIHVETDA